MAVDRSRGAADRSEVTRSEAPGDPLSIPDYTVASDGDADAPGDLPEVTGRSGAIRLGGSSDPPSAATGIDRLRDAARLEISAHREAAAAHLRAETEWDAARDPRVWEPPRKRYAEATSRVWVDTPSGVGRSGAARSRRPGRMRTVLRDGQSENDSEG